MILNIPDNIVHALSWTIIHSIWQISFIAIIMSTILYFVKAEYARLRYLIGLLSLGTVFISCLITFILCFQPSIPSDDIGGAFSSSFHSGNFMLLLNEGNSGWLSGIVDFINSKSVTISQFWIIGVVIFTFKFLFSLGYIQYINHPSGLKNNKRFDTILARLKDKMEINRNIFIAESKRVITPVVSGFIKPIILFPASVATTLTNEEIEIIVAHEIAHIIRNDWIVNMIQSIVEILFYYHPAVWWISAHIREERENCCDDIALQNGFNNLDYARVLVKLKDMQLNYMPSLAMSFFRSENTLLNRIKRLLGQPQNRKNMREKLIAFALIFSVAIAFANDRKDRQEVKIFPLDNDKIIQIDSEVGITFPEPVEIQLDTVPKSSKKESMISIRRDGDKKTIVEIEDGEIKRLEIDGEVIDPEDYDIYVDEIPQFHFDEGTYFFDTDRTFNFDRDFPHRFKIFNDSLPFMRFDYDFGHMEELNEMMEKLREEGGVMELKELEEMMEGLQNERGIFGMEMEELRERMDQLREEGNTIELEELQELMDKLKSENMMPFVWPLNKGEGLKGFFNWDGNEFKDLMKEWSYDWPKLEELKELERFEWPEGAFDSWGRINDELYEPYILDLERLRGGNRINDRIGRELNEDGLLNLDENNEIELSGKHLKINGDKQPQNIWQKYKRIFEENTGMKLTKDSKIEMDVIGKKVRKGYRRI